MPPLPPVRKRQQEPPGATSDANECAFCIGVTVYSKAMADARLPPRCKGIEILRPKDNEFLDEIDKRGGKIRPDNFTLYGLGLSVYAPARLAASKRMPVVRGLGVMVVEEDPAELMKRMEEHKRVRRELGVDDNDEGDEEDDDVVEDLGDEDNNIEPVDGAGLLEKGPLGANMPSKPSMPPLLPTMTFDEFVGKSVDSTKSMALSMYNFWAKRLDGFGDRYQDSCRRLVAQMEKQFWAVPSNIGWVTRKVKELGDQARRGGAGGGFGSDQ